MNKLLAFPGLVVLLLAGCGQAMSGFTPQSSPTFPVIVTQIPQLASSPSPFTWEAAGQTLTFTPSTQLHPTLTQVPQPPTLVPTPLPLAFPLDLLVSREPDVCMAAGNEAYLEPPIEEAAALLDRSYPVDLEWGVVITVTNSSDVVDGDTSGFQALANSPGEDGISLREALLATNNDPGKYTIRFQPGLQGAAIRIGSWDHSELPPLDGGSVIINGDVDGDSRPDIALESALAIPGEEQSGFGVTIRSSNNTLVALKLVDFTNAIFMTAAYKDQVISGNTFSRLVIQGGNGIAGGSGGEGESHNTFSDIKVIGNTFQAKGGMSFGLTRSSMDRIENLIIVDNQIAIASDDESDVYDGVVLTSGYGPESTGNVVRNVLIANNTIEGNGHLGIGLLSGFDGAGGNEIQNIYILNNMIRIVRQDVLASWSIQMTAGEWDNEKGNTISDVLVWGNTMEGYQEAIMAISAGAVGSSGNVIERVRVSDNRIKVLKPVRENGAQLMAISLGTGDGAKDYADPSYQPVVYPDDNLVRDIWISNNLIEGQGGQAVSLGTGVPGAQRNEIREIYVLGNVMDGFYPPSGSMISAVSLYHGGENNRISDVYIQQNSILQTNQREFFIGEEFYSGGIILTSGSGAETNSTHDVWIVGNQIDSPAPGIAILGGWSEPYLEKTVGNEISGVCVWCNVVANEPALLAALFPGVKGINLAGGFGYASDNKVRDITIEKNIVAGVEDDASVYQDVRDSTGNTVDYYVQLTNER